MDEGLRVDRDGFDLACLPRRSGGEAGDAREGDLEDVLIGTCCWPLHADEGFQFGDAGSDLDEAQAQGVELDGAPDGSFRHGCAQTPHQPVGTGMEEQA